VLECQLSNGESPKKFIVSRFDHVLELVDKNRNHELANMQSLQSLVHAVKPGVCENQLFLKFLAMYFYSKYVDRHDLRSLSRTG